ncbi:MAG: hypothetical protein HQM08_24330 [Candidatus Riflebacteria bacterium]|nr:hypothetical protein [Candidatus Riflebacteria bacterium]
MKLKSKFIVSSSFQLLSVLILGLLLSSVLPTFAKDSIPDFTSAQKGLADGTFIPIAFQNPNGLISKKGNIWEISNIRWEVNPCPGTSWYAVPHKYVTARIDPSKALHVYIGRQTVTPLFIHSFLVISFDKGGLEFNGQSSQGLLLTIEPLLRNDQHSWKVPIDMVKGKYPRLYQLASWEDFTVFCGEIMQQMAWLRPLRTKDSTVPQRMVESVLQVSTAAPATSQFDYTTNNCGSCLFPIISQALPKDEADRLAQVLKASSKPNFSRWFQKHLELSGLLDESKPVRMYHDNFFIPLEDLCKGFFPKVAK